jgi:hypothetical protein
MSHSMAQQAPDMSGHIALVQQAAVPLIQRLCDRSAYASDEEFAEILALVRALRQVCGIAG